MKTDVSWVRISTEMFDNKKIRYIRKLPEGNNIVLIWVMLLTMAGRCKSGGFIFLTENIPYTEKSLSDELGFDQSVVQLSISVLESLEMVKTCGSMICVTGFDEYQVTDEAEELDRVRALSSLRVSRYRERQKLLCDDVTLRNVTVTLQAEQQKETEKEKENQKDKEIEKEDIYFLKDIRDKDQGQGIKKDKRKKGELSEEEVHFNEFWAEYPRKVDKKSAKTAYMNALGRAKAEDILAGTKRYAEESKRIGRPISYIKHPTTFIHGDCWNNPFDAISEEKHDAKPYAPEPIYRKME